MGQKEAEDRRGLRMNPVRLELRERRKLNNSNSLYIENVSCDPLSQTKVPALGFVRRKFRGGEVR